MESLNNILKKSLNKEFLSAIISNPREKGGIVKIKIRPVEHKDNILYQCEEHRNNQVFHHNLNEEAAAGYIENAGIQTDADGDQKIPLSGSGQQKRENDDSETASDREVQRD